jgi:hypothetical protein
MTRRLPFLTALVALFALTGGVSSTHAVTTDNRLTYLTFSEPVALPGVTLAPGVYAFELMEPTTSANVVSVRNKARTKAYFMGFTQRIDRPRGMADTGAVSFGEAPHGQARPIVAWYPPDSDNGLRFLYR